MSDQDDELSNILNRVYDKQLTIYDAYVLIHNREAKAEKLGFQKCLMEFDSTEGMREAERRGRAMELNLLNDAIEHLEENIDLATGDYYDTHLGGYVEERRIKLAQSEQEGSNI